MVGLISKICGCLESCTTATSAVVADNYNVFKDDGAIYPHPRVLRLHSLICPLLLHRRLTLLSIADANFLKDKTESSIVVPAKSKRDAARGPVSRSPSPKASQRIKRRASWAEVRPEDDSSSSIAKASDKAKKKEKKSKKKAEVEPEEEADDKPPKLRMTWVGRACLWVMLVGSIPALRVAVGSFVCRPFDLQEWPQVPASAVEIGEHYGEGHAMAFGFRSMAKPTSLLYEELEVPERVRLEWFRGS